MIGRHIYSLKYAKYVYSNTGSSNMVVILGERLGTVTAEVCWGRGHSSQERCIWAEIEFFNSIESYSMDGS